MDIRTSARFEHAIERLTQHERKRLTKTVKRIIEDPSIGKPLRYGRRGERALRMGPRRLIYAHHDTTLYLLTLENRDKAYRTGKR